MSTSNVKSTIVCDNGSGYIKAGYAGDMYPYTRTPTVVGRGAQTPATPACSTAQDVMVGDNCVNQCNHVDLSHPIVNGIIQNWDDMECLWKHVFRDQLQIEPRENKVLLSDPPLNSTKNREKMLEVMFEKFSFAGVYIQAQAVLSLYSQGLMTGVVVDSGASLTHVVPVIDGRADPAHTKRLHVAGDHVTRRLSHLLQMRGYTVGSSESVQAVKERCCYVAVDFDRELALARETTSLATSYTLPDGQSVTVSQERFLASEVLFQPSLVAMESPGLSEVVHSAVHELPIDSRLAMYRAVLLAGGTMMLPGMSTRLERDLQDLYLERVLKGRSEGLSRMRLRVEDPPLRQHMVYTGGSILAEVMADFGDFWISRSDYEEHPQRALEKSCTALGGS